MPKKRSLFGKISPKTIGVVGGVVILVVISIVVFVFVLKNNSSSSGSSSGIKNNLTTLTKWTTTYKGNDVSKSINNVSKFLQLNLGPNKGKNLVISSTPGYIGSLFLMNDFQGTGNKMQNQPGQQLFADINEYTGLSKETFYLGATPGGNGYRNTDLTLIGTDSLTTGAGMVQLLFSMFNTPTISVYSCISGGYYWVTVGDIANLSDTGPKFAAIDGPAKIDGVNIVNMVTYNKMIELNDGRVLLATREKRLFISPNMKNTDAKQIKEVNAPPFSFVRDFTQLKDGTVVIILESGFVFIKKLTDLTNKGISWTKIASFDNMPAVPRQIVELSDGTILSVGSNGFLYFLS